MPSEANPWPRFFSAAEAQRLVAAGAAHVVDVRDRADYLAGHIPGAVNIPQLFYYLAESSAEGLAAMHVELKVLFSRAGITRERPVILYEDRLDARYGGSCRGCWLLTYAGHPAAGVLEEGLAGWRQRGWLLETREVEPERVDFAVRPRPEMIATFADVQAALAGQGAVLVDNRDGEEWRGESSSPYGVDFAPRKGRVPGARWLEWYDLMDRSADPPVFRTPADIRQICAERGLRPGDDLILYCFKGSRSASVYLALRRAGFEGVRVYLGSWNEWSRDLHAPISP